MLDVKNSGYKQLIHHPQIGKDYPIILRQPIVCVPGYPQNLWITLWLTYGL